MSIIFNYIYQLLFVIVFKIAFTIEYSFALIPSVCFHPFSASLVLVAVVVVVVVVVVASGGGAVVAVVTHCFGNVQILPCPANLPVANTGVNA